MGEDLLALGLVEHFVIRPGYRRRVLSAERSSAAGRRCITESISAPVRALTLPRYTRFATNRQLAPPQQAVVVPSVPAIAVEGLDGDRAIVLVFLDQQAHQGGEGKPLLVTGRLSITAQRVVGHRNVADDVLREGP
ncbi:MAG: Mce-associated rane protein [Pseudonocardiales bacterium]|nr:Mce-associated rane protein [Pseudonocardiales bacterium]